MRKLESLHKAESALLLESVTFDLLSGLGVNYNRQPAVAAKLLGCLLSCAAPSLWLARVGGAEMQRAVSSLPLSSSWLAKLASCGFETVEDLQSCGVAELSRGCRVSDSPHVMLC